MPITYIYDREPKPSRCYWNVEMETRLSDAKTTGFVDEDFRKNTGAAAKKYAAELKRRKIKFTHDVVLLSEIPVGAIPGRDMRQDDEFVHIFEF